MAHGSPRWLAKKNRYADAFVALKGLRETPLQAARKYNPSALSPALTIVFAGDLYYIYAQLRVETLLFSRDPETETQLEDWSNHDLYDREARKSNYLTRTVQLSPFQEIVGPLGLHVWSWLLSTLHRGWVDPFL